MPGSEVVKNVEPTEVKNVDPAKDRQMLWRLAETSKWTTTIHSLWSTPANDSQLPPENWCGEGNSSLRVAIRQRVSRDVVSALLAKGITWSAVPFPSDRARGFSHTVL